MQAGTLIGSDVLALTSRILVNGIQRPHLGWSVDRDLVGDLPEQVVAAGGFAQASGTVQWASDEEVTDGGRNPWNPSTGWIPKEGDTVQILAGDGVTEWPQFVGVIDSSTGDVGGGFESKIVDRIDDFSRKVRLPALVDVMPPVDGETQFRRFRLTPRFYVMAAMRRAGFHLVPAPEAACVLDVPAFGSMWPLLGSLRRCYRASDPELSPSWPDGVHVADVSASYAPSFVRSAQVPVQLTICRGPEHAGMGRVRVLYGANTVVLAVNGTEAQAWVGASIVARIPVTAQCVIQYLFDNGKVEIRNSLGATATGTTGWGASGNMTEIQVTADTQARFNGVQVSNPMNPWNRFASLDFTPTARVVNGNMHDTLMACPSTKEQSAADLLTEISQALLWPFWIDETGTAKAIGSDALRGQSSMQTVTTLDDIRSLSWRKDLLGARSEVITSYDTWTINRSTTASIELWSTTESVVLQSGQEHYTLIEEPDDEAWLMVDETLTIPAINTLTDANRGVGSIAGGIYTDGVSEEWATLPSQKKLDVGVEKVTEGVWKIRHAASGVAAGHQVELRTWGSTFSGNTELWPFWWDKHLPIWRGKGKATRTSKTRNPSIAGTVGPVLEHDCKHWGTGHLASNETRVVDAVTDYISTQVVDPQPVITDLRVGYDPRRQLGDVITIKSPTLMGVELRCLVVGVSNSAGTTFEQSLAVRIIDAHSTFTTYQQFADAWGNTSDYDSFAAAWDAISTYQTFSDDPLRGTN